MSVLQQPSSCQTSLFRKNSLAWFHCWKWDLESEREKCSGRTVSLLSPKWVDRSWPTGLSNAEESNAVHGSMNYKHTFNAIMWNCVVLKKDFLVRQFLRVYWSCVQLNRSQESNMWIVGELTIIIFHFIYFLTFLYGSGPGDSQYGCRNALFLLWLCILHCNWFTVCPRLHIACARGLGSQRALTVQRYGSPTLTS